VVNHFGLSTNPFSGGFASRKSVHGKTPGVTVRGEAPRPKSVHGKTLGAPFSGTASPKSLHGKRAAKNSQGIKKG